MTPTNETFVVLAQNEDQSTMNNFVRLRRAQIAANVEITTTIFANAEAYGSESSSTHGGLLRAATRLQIFWKLIEPPNTTPAGFPA